MSEYKILSRALTGLDELTASLNSHIAEGWRVVSVAPARGGRAPWRPNIALVTLARGSESVITSGGQVITLDYPVDPVPRYGYGQPAHQKLYDLIDSGRDRYRTTLERILAQTDHLRKIPVVPPGAMDPSWSNHWMPGLDAAALYHHMVEYNPKLYLEVGSGVSTRFARRAISDHGLRTTIRSIDPHPRVEIDDLCDEVIRSRMEDTDISMFGELEPGDILFIDSSHRSFMNSDVTVLFMDILPSLPAGVLLHIHDIRIPYDYPPEWGPRFYSEQYLLAVHLLAGGPGEVLLPNAFISQDSELSRVLDPLWDEPGFEEVQRHGESFWLRTG